MSAHTPKVTAIIATYNMGAYLPQAIRSVLGQTYGDLELHVVDDGSTDDTRAVVQQFRSDPRLRVTHQANSGQARATNFGIDTARGELVAFCDADDLWELDKLERQLPAFGRDPDIGMVYSRKRRISDTGAPLSDPPDAAAAPAPSGSITNELFMGNFIPYGTALVRRECFAAVGPFRSEYRFGLDWELWLRLSTRYRIEFVDAVTYLYRIWPGQMTKNWRASYDCAFQIMKRFVAEHPQAVRKDVLLDAYADTYARRGYYRAVLAGENCEAIGDALRALKYRPSWSPAYRLIARACAGALGLK